MNIKNEVGMLTKPLNRVLVPSKSRPTSEQIAARAYEIFLLRGAAPGSDVDDWLQAEKELVENN